MTTPEIDRGARKRPSAHAERADVLIVGGGFVGGMLAIALAEAGFEVVVVDRQDPRMALAAAFDGRAFAIALSSKRALAGLGLWGDVEREAAPIRDIRVWEQGSPFFLHYDHRDVGDEPLGYMVESRHLRGAVLRRMRGLERIRLLAPARVESLERAGAAALMTLGDGRRFRGPLAVGADGRDSETRAGAGIRVTTWPYRQTAIVCTVAHARPHHDVAHERFLPGGPFAILPLKGRRSSIVWAERADLAPAIVALGEAEFGAELARRFGDFLGRLRVVGPRWSYPLSLQFAETPVGRRLVLVGDADHAIHPIAGQGLNLGIRDVAALAEVLVEARRLGLDLGDLGVLERYRRWRHFDNTLMIAATDGLTRLFSNNIRPLKFVRDLGLAIVNELPPLKRAFMRHAMGVQGELPRLLQGQRL